MASEGLDIELTRNASQTSTNLWSLGCDITIEEIDTEIQEIRVNDISFAGAVITGDFPFTVNYNGDTISLDVCFTLNGLNPNIVESQVVTYEDILLINDLSPEKTSEKRYASSARSVKEIHDIVSNLKSKVDEIEAEQDENTSGLTEEEKAIFDQLKIFLDWFEYDSENNMIRANHGLYSFGPLVAGGTIQGFQPSAANRLEKLNDVQITDVNGGESLVYNEDLGKWINALIEGGEGGSAKLENDITVDVAVGNIKKGVKLTEGMTITDILTRMFSQAIINVEPTVKITNTPEDCEVGTTVIVDPSCIYTDGKYKTSSGEIAAGCAWESTKYYLEDKEIDTPYTLKTSDAKRHEVQVEVKYAASTANVTTASGEEYTDKIQAGTVTDKKTFNVCYKWFFGSLPKADVQNPTSDKIRTLLSDFILPTRDSMDIISSEVKTDEGKWDVVVVPKGYRLSAVIDSTFLSTYHEQYKSKDVTINCAGDHKKDYRLYYYESTSEMGISKVTIVKE